MPERTTLELARDLADAFAGHDIERLVELSHPEIEIRVLRSSFEGPYTGHTGVRRWLEELLALAPDYWVRTDEIRDAGPGRFVSVGAQGGTTARDDVPFEAVLAIVGRAEDGLIREIRAYRSRAQALEAAGLE